MKNSVFRNKAVFVKGFVAFFLFFSLVTFNTPTFAKSQAAWAGVSIDENSISSAPVAASLLTDLEKKPLDVQARVRIKERPFKNIEFINREDNTEGIIVTATILRESLQIVKDNARRTPTYNHTYRVFVNLMAFDWDVDGAMGRYVGSVPIVVDYLDVSDAPHSKTVQEQIFKSMYVDNSLGGGLNVFDEIYNFAKELMVEGYLDKFPQISSVEMKPEALKYFKLDKTKLADWKYMAKQFFEAQLVKYSGSVLVPSMSEERMNLEFRVVFSDKSQAIVLPEPAGELKIFIEELRPINTLDGVQRSVCHISFIRLVVIDELDEELMSRKFARGNETCFVTHKDNKIDDNQLYNESMLVLLKDIARQFGPNVDQGWLTGFGVPANVVPKYVAQISRAKDELLQSYR